MARTQTWPRPEIPVPSTSELEQMLQDHVFDTGDSGCETSDGCTVEADGVCVHGHPTWLRMFGLI